MLKVVDINFSYHQKKVIDAVSFSLPKGKHLAIIGESGCGKSTLLQLIYGLHNVSSGTIFWKENQILGPAFHLVPGMPFIKYLAQDFNLMPYISVAENVGEYLSNFYPKEKNKRIEELLEVVEMTTYKNTKVKYLSGGQMQRVALAKALAKQPEIILLDEPFSHIDNFRKNNLRRKIFNYLKENAITCITATHDVNDSLSFSDAIMVLKNGAIMAFDSPEKLYAKKQNNYIASLFNDVNQLENKLFYPDEITITTQATSLQSVVIASYFKGTHYLIEVITENKNVLYVNHQTSLVKNTKIYLDIKKHLK